MQEELDTCLNILTGENRAKNKKMTSENEAYIL